MHLEKIFIFFLNTVVGCIQHQRLTTILPPYEIPKNHVLSYTHTTDTTRV